MALTAEQLVGELDRLAEKYDFAQHPLWVLAHRGELTKEQFSNYIAQRWWFTVEFPAVLAGIMSKLKRDLRSRRQLLHNLMEEDLEPRDHITLYLKLARALGWTEQALVELEEIPEAVAQRTGFLSLMENSTLAECLAIGYVTEGQVPRYHWIPREVMEKKYGLAPEEYEWMTIHWEVDTEHGENYKRVLLSHMSVEDEEQRQLLRKAEDGLKLMQLFYDGCYRYFVLERGRGIE
jgi:pyrroloquinoline quinone (PQQ) biosynthesis protein C